MSIICLSAVYMHSTCACIFLGVTLYRNKFFVKTTVHVHVNLHVIEAFIVTHVHMYKINIHVHVCKKCKTLNMLNCIIH